MALQETRRQHYVWREYLRSWCLNGKDVIWATRGAKPFLDNIMNLAKDEYFYEIESIDKGKIRFIHDFWLKDNNVYLKYLNLRWVRMFSELTDDGFIKALNINDADKTELSHYIKTNTIEKSLAELEKTWGEILRKLIEFDASYFDEDNVIKTLFFLTMQYYRTKNIKERVLSAANKFELSDKEHFKFMIESTWPIAIFILANTLAYSIYERDEHKLVFLENKTNEYFVTSDLPVINIYNGIDIYNKTLGSEKLELYYPLTPHKAVLLSPEACYASFSKIFIDETSVKIYNNAIKKQSCELIFSHNEKELL